MRSLAEAVQCGKGRSLKQRRKAESEQKSRRAKTPQYGQTRPEEPAEAARRFVLSHPHYHLVFQGKGCNQHSQQLQALPEPQLQLRNPDRFIADRTIPVRPLPDRT
jgi:hypothetical protein